MKLVQIAQRAEDLARATAFYRDLPGAAPTASYDPPGLVFFGHDDDTLGPSGTDEWQAFVRDSEGNLVGLVEQRPRT